jgi:hypothetical protein
MRVIKLSNRGVVNWLEENRNSRRRNVNPSSKGDSSGVYTYSNGKHSLIGQIIHDVAGVDIDFEADDNYVYVKELDIRAPAGAIETLTALEFKGDDNLGSSWGTVIKTVEAELVWGGQLRAAARYETL